MTTAHTTGPPAPLTPGAELARVAVALALRGVPVHFAGSLLLWIAVLSAVGIFRQS